MVFSFCRAVLVKNGNLPFFFGFGKNGILRFFLVLENP